jgi:hypothetical protein
VRPLAFPVLYLQQRIRDAAPKCISRRTSYLRVRLAFHPYPQLIRAFFNIHRFGPPRGVTPASTWPWVDHAVSGLIHATNPPAPLTARGAGALFRLAFARPPEVVFLKQRHGLTRRLILQKARRHPSHKDIGLRLLVGGAVSGTLSLPSRGAFHLSLTVLVRYRWQEVFSLGRWSSQIPTGFLEPRGTQEPARGFDLFA